MTVNLTGVTDVQRITVTLSGVTDSLAQVLPDTAVSVDFLIGDTNGDRFVNAGDTTQTRSRSGQTATATNFRSDVNHDGTINSGDTVAVRDAIRRFAPINAVRDLAIFEAVDKCKCLDSLCMVKQFLEFVIRQLVEFPDEVMLSEIPSGRTTLFRVQMRQTDVGRIIGRNGQTIQAVRALLASSAARHDQRVTLEIVE